MAMTRQFLNSATLYPANALQCFQQHGLRAVVNGVIGLSGAGADGVANQSTQESVDQVRLSQAARQALAALTHQVDYPGQTQNSTAIAAGSRKSTRGTNHQDENDDPRQLSAGAQQKLMELEKRDREVKIREAERAALGGRYSGAPKLSYVIGPDGKCYVVESKVNVDMGVVAGDPEATIKKAEVIRSAALATAQPSPQDRNIAAQAAHMKLKAQAQLLAENNAATDRMVADLSMPSSANQENLLRGTA